MKWIFSAVALILFTASCGYSPGARSTLTLAASDDGVVADMPIGFTDAMFDDHGGAIVIVGHGWMPREHETRIYAWNRELTPVRSRWFRLTSAPPVDDEVRSWTIELVVDPALPETGEVSASLVRNDTYSTTFEAEYRLVAGKLAMEFPNIRLSNVEEPDSTILISGHILAPQASYDEIRSMHQDFELALNYR